MLRECGKVFLRVVEQHPLVVDKCHGVLQRTAAGRLFKLLAQGFHALLLALHHARLQRVEPAVNFALVRHGDLRRVRRRRRPCIGNKIGDRHVGLMPDGGDDRNVGGINRARHALIVERPQIFNRPAAAPRDDEVGDLPFVCVAQRACDLRRRLCSLHAHRQEHDFAHRPARIQNAQHIMHRRARG